jgi:hypothetical protein
MRSKPISLRMRESARLTGTPYLCVHRLWTETSEDSTETCPSVGSHSTEPPSFSASAVPFFSGHVDSAIPPQTLTVLMICVRRKCHDESRTPVLFLRHIETFVSFVNRAVHREDHLEVHLLLLVFCHDVRVVQLAGVSSDCRFNFYARQR